MFLCCRYAFNIFYAECNTTSSSMPPKNEVSRSALDSIPDMPIMEELDVLPTIEELDKALNALASGKASGPDGIPPEILKTSTHATSVRTLLPLLGKGLCSSKYAGRHLYHPTRTRAIKVTVTTTVAFLSSILLGRPLLGFLSVACKSLHHAFTPVRL